VPSREVGRPARYDPSMAAADDDWRLTAQEKYLLEV
jgi:hypothetical protein